MNRQTDNQFVQTGTYIKKWMLYFRLKVPYNYGLFCKMPDGPLYDFSENSHKDYDNNDEVICTGVTS